MHFTVLSAIPPRQGAAMDMNAIPSDDVIRFMKTQYLLTALESKGDLPALDLSPAAIQENRWECLVRNMVGRLLAPYDENTTNIAYVEFDDQTDEGRKAYAQGSIDCVRTPDGRVIPCVSYEFSGRYELCEGKVYQSSFGPLHHRKRTKTARKYLPLPDYPFKKYYPTFDVFMADYYGCERQEGTDRYGYYFNANAKWDWWQIGGRWPFCFLVKDDCPSAIVGHPSALFCGSLHRDTPEGYRWVAGARKGDIAWDMMRESLRNEATKQFLQWETWFTSGQIPEEYAGSSWVVADGLVAHNRYLYHVSDGVETYLHLLGLSDCHPYAVRTHACLDADGWDESSWDTPEQEEAIQTWHSKTADFIKKQPDDALLVLVDYHA